MTIGATIVEKDTAITIPKNAGARNIVFIGATFHIPDNTDNDSEPTTNCGGLALKKRITKITPSIPAKEWMTHENQLIP